MKTLTQLKQAMKAPMYSELSSKELLLYKTGFKNGYRMSTGIKIDKKKIHSSTLEAVINKVCIQYEVNKKEVLGDRRYQSLVKARSIIINLMIELHKVSLSQLGRMLDMDHSTIIHHRSMKFDKRIYWSSEKTIHEEFVKIKEELTTS